MIISFIGHSLVISKSTIEKTLGDQLEILIEDKQEVICYLGGYGDFDEIAGSACVKLKKKYKTIETVYVSPYMSMPEQRRIKEMIELGLYDSSVYPPIENTPPKFAISKRNEWMMKNADVVVAFVKHNCGGAYKSLSFARRIGKKIINIAELL